VAPRPRSGGSGAGSFLLVVGCLAVLGATFTLGVMAGRHWPSFPFAKKESVAKAARDRDRDRSARAPESTPTLTFYQELTAPLAAPPPPAKPSKPARGEKAEPPKPDAPKPEAARPEPVKPEPQFTVQVGAYKAREPAETLRARLAAQGHDAYVVAADEPGGVRFRVRVGAFATREAAQAVAARIAGDRTLSAFVTAR